MMHAASLSIGTTAYWLNLNDLRSRSSCDAPPRPHTRFLHSIGNFFIRSGLSFYCLFDSSSHESQKSTPDYIDNYAAYETCGQ